VFILAAIDERGHPPEKKQRKEMKKGTAKIWSAI
jgi:hypothetical protein